MSTINDVLEPYRVDVYGDARNSLNTCVAALDAQSDKLAIAHCSLNGIERSITDEYAAQVIAGVYDLLGDVIKVTNRIVTTLADCEAK